MHRLTVEVIGELFYMHFLTNGTLFTDGFSVKEVTGE